MHVSRYNLKFIHALYVVVVVVLCLEWACEFEAALRIFVYTEDFLVGHMRCMLFHVSSIMT